MLIFGYCNGMMGNYGYGMEYGGMFSDSYSGL